MLTELRSEDRLSLHSFLGYREETRYLVKQAFDLNLLDGCCGIREMEMLLRLAHPKIVPLHAICFRDQPKPSLCYTNYDSLGLVFPAAIRDLCGFTERNPQEILRLLVDILSALEHLHASGYIHGDLKPNNILLFREDRELVAKVCDLGSCQEISDAPHASNITTVQYAAPEQFHRGDYGPAIDIWSFGCLVYYLITGRHPISLPLEEYPDTWTSVRHAIDFLPRPPNYSEIADLITTGKNPIDPSQMQEILTKWIADRPSESDWISHFRQLDQQSASSNRHSLPGGHQAALFASSLAINPNHVEQLLDSTLAFHPSRRLTATELLALPIFQEYRRIILPAAIRVPAPALPRITVAIQTLRDRSSSDQIDLGKWIRDIIKLQYRISASYLDTFFTGTYLIDAWLATRPDGFADQNEYHLLLVTAMIIGCKYHCALGRHPICFQNVVERRNQTKKMRERYLALERELVVALAGSISDGRRSPIRSKDPSLEEIVSELQAYGAI